MASHVLPYLKAKVHSFRGGQLSLFRHKWERLTTDNNILQTISGDSITFISNPPTQVSYPPNSIPRDHASLVDREIKSLLDRGVIVLCNHEPGEFISPIFTVLKKDGNVRLILNLKRLNAFIENSHFKMDTIHTILRLVTPNCWMASLDLKDAYYSVRIHPDFQKYLKFTYHGLLYQYTVFPNGLSTCPRKFTKMMKPPLSHLRLLNHIISGYIDDFYLQGSTYLRCAINVIDSIKMLDNIGLVIHPEKSVFIPQQQITFLGFVIDSLKMIVRLTDDKIRKIKEILQCTINNSHSVKIRDIARIIGYMISSLPAVRYGALYYRYLEMDKIKALKQSKGDFEASMSVSKQGISEMRWWLDNLDHSYNTICHPPVDIILYSDASLMGWGAVMNKTSTGGRWSPMEAENHINYLELLAAFFALKCFQNSISGKHVKLMIDNTTAVSVINNMGTCHSLKCNEIAVQIWEFCQLHNVTWLTAAHIPGSSNVTADRESRNFHSEDTEWMINPKLLNKALDALNFKPEIDLFASRLNRQFSTYCSFRPDPEAYLVDAFTVSWSEKQFYCFPPFSCVLRVLQKIIQDKATGVVVVPMWPTQSWYPILTSLLVLPPITLPPSKNLLSLPAFPEVNHPLHRKMSLLICLLSGNNSRI